MIVMVGRGPGVGARLRVEGDFQAGDPTPEPGHHFGDNVVGVDAQPIADDLQRQMPVAEMPRNPKQVRRTVRCDLEEWLGRRPHPHKAAAVELEPVAIGEVMGARKIKEKALA
jgi:hypothetical protein